MWQTYWSNERPLNSEVIDTSQDREDFLVSLAGQLHELYWYSPSSETLLSETPEKKAQVAYHDYLVQRVAEIVSREDYHDMHLEYAPKISYSKGVLDLYVDKQRQ